MGKAKGPRQKTIPKLGELGTLLERFQKSMDNLDKLEDLEKSLDTEGTVRISNKQFTLDTDKIESLEDVKLILKSMDMQIYWYSEECPEKFKTLYDKGLLKEVKDENI